MRDMGGGGLDFGLSLCFFFYFSFWGGWFWLWYGGFCLVFFLWGESGGRSGDGESRGEDV